VQYDKVNAMLLNEVQQQHRELGAQAEQIRALTAQLAALAARLQGIESTRFSTDAR
jgi:type II secretory pathway component PulJ